MNQDARTRHRRIMAVGCALLPMVLGVGWALRPGEPWPENQLVIESKEAPAATASHMAAEWALEGIFDTTPPTEFRVALSVTADETILTLVITPPTGIAIPETLLYVSTYEPAEGAPPPPDAMLLGLLGVGTSQFHASLEPDTETVFLLGFDTANQRYRFQHEIRLSPLDLNGTAKP